MFEILDSLLGPLFRLNPFKYLRDSAYRSRVTKELGKEARHVFCYQLVFALALLILLILVSESLWRS